MIVILNDVSFDDSLHIKKKVKEKHEASFNYQIPNPKISFLIAIQ